MDPLETAIRSHLDRYLAGALTLNDVQDWLVRSTLGMEETASPHAVQLACAIELVLAELTSGYLTPNQRRADLRNIADDAPLHVKTTISA